MIRQRSQQFHTAARKPVRSTSLASDAEEMRTNTYDIPHIPHISDEDPISRENLRRFTTIEVVADQRKLSHPVVTSR
jgi:hypothetical protein